MFVHPQIKVNFKNLKKVISGFLAKSKEQELKQKLETRFPNKKIVFCDMGRTAFKIIIEKYGLAGSKMAMPAYICDIFFPILKQYNINPLFIEPDKSTFNIDLESLKAQLTSDVKAVLVSHTYGLQADINKLREIVGNILIIEDCAHALGVKHDDGTYVGNLGDVSFFSLYKQTPAFRGGFLVCPKDWEINLEKTKFNIRDFISFLNSFSLFAFLFKTFGDKIAQRNIRKEKHIEPYGANKTSLNFFYNFLDEFESSLQNRIESAKFFQIELEKLGFKVQPAQNNVFCYLSALVPENKKEKRKDFLH
jgi:dTDP-4-amino-4,6-dideoxygalactose transaminase